MASVNITIQRDNKASINLSGDIPDEMAAAITAQLANEVTNALSEQAPAAPTA